MKKKSEFKILSAKHEIDEIKELQGTQSSLVGAIYLNESCVAAVGCQNIIVARRATHSDTLKMIEMQNFVGDSKYHQQLVNKLSVWAANEAGYMGRQTSLQKNCELNHLDDLLTTGMGFHSAQWEQELHDSGLKDDLASSENSFTLLQNAKEMQSKEVIGLLKQLMKNLDPINYKKDVPKKIDFENFFIAALLNKNQQYIALAGCRPRAFLKDGKISKVVNIQYFVVDEEHQEEGCGRELISNLAKWAYSEKYDSIQVITGKQKFIEAKEFYYKAGFKLSAMRMGGGLSKGFRPMPTLPTRIQKRIKQNQLEDFEFWKVNIPHSEEKLHETISTTLLKLNSQIEEIKKIEEQSKILQQKELVKIVTTKNNLKEENVKQNPVQEKKEYGL